MDSNTRICVYKVQTMEICGWPIFGVTCTTKPTDHAKDIFCRDKRHRCQWALLFQSQQSHALNFAQLACTDDDLIRVRAIYGASSGERSHGGHEERRGVVVAAGGEAGARVERAALRGGRRGAGAVDDTAGVHPHPDALQGAQARLRRRCAAVVSDSQPA